MSLTEGLTIENLGAMPGDGRRYELLALDHRQRRLDAAPSVGVGRPVPLKPVLSRLRRTVL